MAGGKKLTVSTFWICGSCVIVMYTNLLMNSFGADLPTSSHTCSKALETHEKRISSAMQMAPIGSRYHTKRSPTMDMTRPKMLTTMSFR